MHTFERAVLVALLVVVAPCASAADRVSGTIVCSGMTLEVKHGWLVRGPNSTYGSMKGLDDLSNPKTMLRIYLTDTDVGDEIKKCPNLSCTKSAIGNGLSLDVGDAKDTPELWYRMWSEDGNSKCNNSLDRAKLKLTTNTPDRLAGSLHFDEMNGTEKADVEFDLTVGHTVKTEYQFQ